MDNQAKMLKNKKAQRSFSINDLGSIAISLVIAVIVLGIGASILANIQSSADTSVNLSDTGTWNAAYNATGSGIAGLSTMSSYVPTIALVAVAAIVIGIIIVFFGRGKV